MKDNLLVAVSLVVIVFSIGGLISSYGLVVEIVSPNVLTGHATSTGTINVTITENVLANLTSSNVNWGTGAITGENSNATIDTLGNISRGNWSALSSGLVIKNEGNVALVLDFQSNKNATNFIGGTSSSFKYMITNVDSGACTPPDGFVLGTFYETNTSTIQICDSFAPNESVRMDFELTIPSNSNLGILSSTITIGYNKVT